MKMLRSLRARVMMGFATIIVICVAAFGVTLYLANTFRHVDADRKVAIDEASSAAYIDRTSVASLAALSAFLRSGAVPDRDKMNETVAQLGEALATAGGGETAGELKQLTAAAAAAILMALDNSALLVQSSGSLANSSTAIAEVASRSPEPTLLGSVGRLQVSIGQLGTAGTRYALTGAPRDLDAIGTETKRIGDWVTEIEANSATSARLRKLSGVLTGHLGTFDKVAQDVVLAFAARQAAVGKLEAALANIAATARGKMQIARKHLEDAVASSEAASRTLFATIVGSSIGVLIVGLGLALKLSSSITGPIITLKASITSIAQHNLDAIVPSLDRVDEIGEMAAAVQVFKESMIRTDQLTAEQDALKAASTAAQKTTMNQTADTFEEAIGGLAAILFSAATELEATAQTMTETARQTNGQAAAVAVASEQATISVGTVAAAAEELTASIGEISRQVSQSSRITSQAVVDARRTDAVVHRLSQGADKIGHVVGLITNIASQTNLLALNATIEAARAGESGKGFAVVASEVKGLANQTTKATKEIDAQVAELQSATKEAVEAISAIVATITEVSMIGANIAAAIEQQGAATAEIGRSVQQTAHSAQEVSSNISGVSQAATQTGTAAGQVLSAAGDLSRQAEQLTGEVGRFVANVRVA